MKRKKRLSDAEIRKAVDKIRQRYGDYIVTFQKGQRALNGFEERYISAMRARLDLQMFLHAEMTVIEELIASEKKRVQDQTQRAKSVVKMQAEQKSVADRVIAENHQRIVKYPRMLIHQDASDELERLFGSLGTIERQFWPDIEHLIREAYPSTTVSPRARLEEQLLKYSCLSSETLPPRVSRYRSLFGWYPRNYPEIEKEEKKCILEIAFFLHDLGDTLREIGKVEALSTEDRQKVDTMKEYVHNIITDFRLKDLRYLQR